MEGFSSTHRHHGLLRRVEVQPHDIGGLGRKLRVCAHLMGPSPLQMDAMLTQHALHAMDRHVPEGFGQQGGGPGRVAGRRRLRHHVEDALLGLLVIPPRRTWPRRVLQPVQAVRGKARSPLAHRGVADPPAVRRSSPTPDRPPRPGGCAPAGRAAVSVVPIAPIAAAWRYPVPSTKSGPLGRAMPPR